MLLFMKMKILKQHIVEGELIMIELYKRSGVIIPRRYEKEVFYQKIRGSLFRRSRQYNTPDYIIQKFFIESDKHLIVPRFFPVQEYVNCKINDISHDGEIIDITHSITLRNDTQRNTVDYMLRNQSGVIELQPGMGKTIISIYVIASRKKKSLILVHRDSLADQWKDRFLEFTSLNNEDISRLTSTTFEEDLKKPIIIATNQSFISLLKRKGRNFLISLDKANIGIFISDEAHTTIAASVFSGCSIHVPAKVVFGLSATPYRWDGNSDIIEYHVGKPFKIDDITGTVKPNITVLMFDYGVDTSRRFKYLYWEGKFQRSRYLNLLKNSRMLMAVSKSLLEKFYVTERNVIFVSERIKFIDDIYNWSKEMFPSVSKFIAGSKNDQLEEQITYSTPGKIRDGVDIPKKDCLIMTSPISNITQICGRVIRESINKKRPIIIDMIDLGCQPIRSTYRKRMKYYKSKEWDIQYVLILQNLRKKIITEEEALCI